MRPMELIEFYPTKRVATITLSRTLTQVMSFSLTTKNKGVSIEDVYKPECSILHLCNSIIVYILVYTFINLTVL